MLVYSLAGELILGSRFKRLSDKYLTNVSQIYKAQQIDFEPSWFSVFYILDRYGSISISDMSQLLDITQSAISQMVSSLESKGLVKVETHERDRRVRIVSFTKEGRELLFSVKPLWKLIRSKMREILNEGDSSKYLLDALDELEASFEKKPLYERVLETLRESRFLFVKYTGIYYAALKKLVFDWMFNFGAPNMDFVNDFKGLIERSKDKIILAVRDREVVAAALGFIDGSLNCLVCDREDVDNRVAYSLLSKFLESMETPSRVFFDADKPMIENLLEKNGFRMLKVVERDDVKKRLAVYGREVDGI